MKFYIAGPYAARDVLEEVADYLEEAGHVSTGRWMRDTHEIHEGTVDAAPGQTDAYCVSHVEMDLADIDRADVVIVITTSAARELDVEANTSSGGRHVETGYALGRGIPLILVGDAENIFHRHGPAVRVDSVAQIEDALRVVEARNLWRDLAACELPIFQDLSKILDPNATTKHEGR